jgi:hypothetical protein
MPTVQHHLSTAVETLAGTAADKVGYLVAGGMIAAPLWRDQLHDWAGVATDVAPFLGCAWLVVQMVAKVLEARRKMRLEDGEEA